MMTASDAGIEPEIWRNCSKRSVLQRCAAFGHLKTHVAVTLIQIPDLVKNMGKVEWSRSGSALQSF